MGEIARLQQIIDESRNLVFFGGAGVSTESGTVSYTHLIPSTKAKIGIR